MQRKLSTLTRNVFEKKAKEHPRAESVLKLHDQFVLNDDRPLA